MTTPAPGTCLGPYEITARIGEGGMGLVFKAKDFQLGREVALKVLPEGFSADPERVARFEREAKLLASLNHPNIAQIYGIETAPDGTRALVMELVEGPTLAERLAEGSLPLDESLSIARQIADALEEAHEKGIIHRDLKPQNIKASIEGKVKVLDFGLAKAMDVAGSASTGSPSAAEVARSPTLMNSPTLTGAHGTQLGMILGTAAYMSPEQARGRAVDRRADIWSFGVVLYEMLTGRRLFAGEEISDVLAAVLRQEIDWGALPVEVPTRIRRLLARCLDRDPKRRLRDIGEARVALGGGDEFESAERPVPAGQAAARVPTPLWRRIATGAAIGAIASLLGGALVWNARQPAAPRLVRFAITLGTYQVATRVARNMVAVSPDGTRIAYVVDRQIYLKRQSDVEGQPITGASDAQAIIGPVFSPDGEAIVYYSWGEQAIRRIPAEGGSAETVCETEAPDGLTWSGDSLYFGLAGGLLRVSANGGTPELLIPARTAANERLFGPQLLPGGKSLLFAVAAGGTWNTTGEVVVQSLASGERTVLVGGGAADPRYLPTGHILFMKGGAVQAVAFDAATLRTRGSPVRLVEGVRRAQDSRAMDLATSATGTLVYVPGPVSGEEWRLALFDRNGGMEPLAIPAGSYSQPRLSPDGRRIALGNVESADMAIWIAEMSGDTAARRLTFEGLDRFPVWSSDGVRVTFQSQRGDDRSLFWMRADGAGTAERLTQAEPGAAHAPQSWSPDGSHLLFDVTQDGLVSIWLYSSRDRTSRRLVSEGSRVPSDAVFSPDGRWFAYTTEGTSRAKSRVYVQPFPPTGSKYLVSGPDEDGHHAVWSRDGRELFYTPGPGTRLQRVTVTTAPSLQFSQAVTLQRRFTNAPPSVPRTYDVTSDGRFLGLIESEAVKDSGVPLSQIYVVLNWFEELKAKVPVR